MYFFKNLTVKQKIILSVLALLLIVDVALLVQKYISKSSSLTLSFPSEYNVAPSPLTALNVQAQSSKVKQGYAYYGFSNEQRMLFKSYFDEYGDAALVIHVLVSQDEKTVDEMGIFMYGFLFENDFTRNGKLQKEINSRPLVRTRVSSFNEFELALSLQKKSEGNSDPVPYGFFVHSSVSARVTGCAVSHACVGFDRSGSIPFFAFPPNGGNVEPNLTSVDFSGASLVFPTQNTLSAVMPKIIVSFTAADNYGTSQNPAVTVVNAGGEKLTIYRTKTMRQAETYTIQTSALANPFAQCEAGDDIHQVNALLMVRNTVKKNIDASNKVLSPFATDPGLIIKWPQNSWRTADYELFAWDRFPDVLLMDTRNYSVQDDFFKRLAFYVEKTGYRGMLISDDELHDKHGFNAHDYRAESLAAFFTKAQAENFPLNEKENLLCNILLANGILVKSQNGYEAGTGAIISISKESNEWLRARLLTHEGWHGIFFTDEKFRNTTAAVYYTIDERYRDFLLGYWQSQPTLNYDITDEYLMHNEFMAYIMQQSVSEVASYFVNFTNWTSVLRTVPDLALYVRATRGIAFEDAAYVFDAYAFDNWGLSCGRIWTIR